MTITQPANLNFIGSNGREEMGGPVFSAQPFSERAAFYQCDTLTGFPVGGGYVHNRSGGSSFIAQKLEANGKLKSWICASVGSFTSSGGPGSYREFQIRYFSGDPSTGTPASMVIGQALPAGFFSPDVTVTNFNVEIHYAPSDITIHRLQPDAIANRTMRDGWDGNTETMLVPSKSRDRLAASAVDKVQGVVADGVTPLLIQVKKKDISAGAKYGLRAAIRENGIGGGQIAGLNQRINVLGPGGWVRSINVYDYHEVQPLPLAGGEGDQYVFAVLDAIRPDEVQFDVGRTVLSCEIILEELTTEGAPTGRKEMTPFQILKPPIVLVHGYFSDGTTWKNSFLNPLKEQRPEGFVIPITYPDSTSGDFDYLAKWLETELANKVEYSEGPIFKNWAVTRYDVIAHSQGGILTRMLCQNYPGENVPRFADRPFRNGDNHYRGRFGRVVTIGSPHNGLRGFRYIENLRKTDFAVLPILLHWGGFGPLQPKFDPYGEQIKMINDSNYRADLGTKFHLVTTTITDGRPPKALATLPRCYGALPGFTIPKAGDTVPRGEYVFPKGSDGGVDPDSGAAYPPAYGSKVNKTFAMPGNISHAGIPFLFGVEAENSQTANPEVARKALELLDGNASEFGPFILPKIQTDSQIIDSLAPNIHDIQFDIIFLNQPDPAPSPDGPQPAPSPDGASAYTYRLQPTAGEPLEGPINWFAEAFSPHGPTVDGITVEADAIDPTKVTVTVESSVEGDVVIYGNYPTTNNRVVMGRPKLVVAQPTASPLTGVELRSSEQEPVVGMSGELILWGIYGNGNKAPLFTGNELEIASSAPATASVNANGSFATHAPGEVTFSTTFRGFSTSTTVVSKPPPATNSSLTSLIPAGGTLSPPFSSGVSDYTITVPFETDTFELTATAEDPRATLRIFGNDLARTVASGATSGPIALNVGPNEIHVRVIAEDRVTTTLYTVSVLRAEMFSRQLALSHPQSTPQSQASHGKSIAANQDYIVVGAPTGNPIFTGSVTVYRTADGSVVRLLKNPAAQAHARSSFGDAVALSGTRLAVGAPGSPHGPAYVHIFDLAAANPDTPIITITNPSGSSKDYFGAALALQGNRLAVGAPSAKASGIEGGLAYVYDLGSTNPGQPLAILKHPQPAMDDEFGSSLVIKGDKVLVGARFTNAGRGSVIGFDMASQDPQAAVFTLADPNGGYSFGQAMALEGESLLIGAPFSWAGTIYGGAVHLYRFDGDTAPTLTRTIMNPEPSISDFFGTSVAISGRRVAVGADHDDTTGEDGGSAYLFDLDHPAPGIPVAVFNTPLPAAGDNYGHALALAGDRLAIGAPEDSTTLLTAGAAYLHDLNSPVITEPLAILGNPGAEDGMAFGSSIAAANHLVLVGADEGAYGGTAHLYDITSPFPDRPIANYRLPASLDGYRFGQEVALSTELVAVAFTNSSTNSGEVMVFRAEDADDPQPVLTLSKPSDAYTGFAGAIAATGKRVITSATGATGAVFVYDTAAPQPTVPAITIPAPVPNSLFGISLAVSGNLLVVGASQQQVGGFPEAGCAYVYDLAAADPTRPLHILENPYPDFNDWFGRSTAVSGSRVSVGATQDRSRPGSIFVYELDGASPTVPVTAMEDPSGGYPRSSLALNGNQLVAGSYRYATGGAITHYLNVYDLNRVDASQPVATISNPQADSEAPGFGLSVAVADGRIFAGSPLGYFTGTDRGSGYVHVFGDALMPRRPAIAMRPAAGQTNPGTGSSVRFEALFSESVTGFDAADVVLSGSANPTTVAVQGTGANYIVEISGMDRNGTVTARILPKAAQSANGTWSVAADDPSESVLHLPVDVTAPSVAINQAVTQFDPTISPSVEFTVVFSEDVTGFDEGDIAVGGTAAKGEVQVAGIGRNYTVKVSGLTTSGTIVLTIPAGAATDAAGNASTASSSTDNSVNFLSQLVFANINQQPGQGDPTSSPNIYFEAFFNKLVTGFTADDIILGGTAGATHVVVNGSPAFSGVYAVIVSGMTQSGTVTASIRAGAAADANGNPSLASMSTDNTVTYQKPPAVTINQAAGQGDPASVAGILFDVVFDQEVTGFTGADVLLGGTAAPSAAVVSGSGAKYQVKVFGMTGAGTVTASIPASSAINSLGVYNTASSSTDNTVAYDNSDAPTVTVNQVADQHDPTTDPEIRFQVFFSKPVSGFDFDDLEFGGSSAKVSALSMRFRSSVEYEIVALAASTGDARLSIPPGIATDNAGRPNAASTSTDNTVSFSDSIRPLVTVNQAVGQMDPATISPVLFDIKFNEEVSGFNAAKLVTGGTAQIKEVTTVYTIGGVFGSNGARVRVHPKSNGTITLTLPEGAVIDQSGNPSEASTSVDNSVLFNDTTPPAVTINQKSTQEDPTATSPVRFTITFSETVNDFDFSDLSFSGTAVPGSMSYTRTGSVYELSVSPLSGGVMTLSLPAGVVTDDAGNPNTASTSSDNSIQINLPNTVNTLASLQVSEGALSPAFSSGTSSYSVSVPFSTSSITVTPTARALPSTIRVKGVEVASGSASAPIPLVEGSNSIPIVVTSETGSTRTYNLTVSRAAVPRPEIAVLNPAGKEVATGSSEDIGITDRGSFTNVTFTILNSGPGTLDGLAATIEGGSSSDFQIIKQPDASVPALTGTTTLTVRFQPGAPSSRSTTLKIANSDADESPFVIFLSGWGATRPQLEVSKAGDTPLANGGVYELGDVFIGTGATVTFQIRNGGWDDLMSISATLGTNAAAEGYKMTVPLKRKLLSGGGTAPFTVQMLPTSEGLKTTKLRIESNDLLNNPYEITLRATARRHDPDIALESPAQVPLGAGATLDFGTPNPGKKVTKVVLIRNTGKGELRNLSGSLSGPEAGSFTMKAKLPTVVKPGKVGNVKVTFYPTTPGTKSATLTITSNDPDESPFEIRLAGASPAIATLAAKGTAKVWDEEVDSDGDGLSDLLEWATGSDPSSYSVSPLRCSLEDGQMVVEYPRRDEAMNSGIRFQLEWSGDMQTWHIERVTETTTIRDGGISIVRAKSLTSGHSQRFARLRVLAGQD